MNYDHPLDNLLKTAMGSLRDMIDVNTIMGKPVDMSGGTSIIPISKVSLGFAAGGTEIVSQEEKLEEKKENNTYTTNSSETARPFGGGSGAGISLTPVGFLVVTNEISRFVPAAGEGPIDRIIDLVPDLLSRIGLNKDREGSFEETSFESTTNTSFIDDLDS